MLSRLPALADVELPLAELSERVRELETFERTLARVFADVARAARCPDEVPPPDDPPAGLRAWLMPVDLTPVARAWIEPYGGGDVAPWGRRGASARFSAEGMPVSLVLDALSGGSRGRALELAALLRTTIPRGVPAASFAVSGSTIATRGAEVTARSLLTERVQEALFALRTSEPVLHIEYGIARVAWTTRWHPLGGDALPAAALAAIREIRAGFEGALLG